jgi:hypothetical protein
MSLVANSSSGREVAGKPLSDGAPEHDVRSGATGEAAPRGFEIAAAADQDTELAITAYARADRWARRGGRYGES